MSQTLSEFSSLSTSPTGAMPTRIYAGEMQRQYLVHRLGELASVLGDGPIALYGGGRHTEMLLARHKGSLPEIAFILDDGAKRAEIAGVPVKRPADADPSRVRAVVVSSDADEATLGERSMAWAGGVCEVVRLYEGRRVEHLPPEHAGSEALCEQFQRDYARGLLATWMTDYANRRARFYNLLTMCRLTDGLCGETAEAGCYRGLSSLLMCEAERRVNPEFDGTGHTVIDSFEGFAPPRSEDGDFSKCRFDEGEFTDSSEAITRATLHEFPGVRFVKGWIPAVFEAMPEKQYRFVHIDVDLYDPTLACLEYFYPRLVPGGIIVVDDHGPWHNSSYPGCALACRAFEKAHDAVIAGLSSGNAVLIKR